MHTTAQVAEKLDIDQSHVRRLAIKHAIGNKVSDRVRIFSDADMDTLRSKLSGDANRGRPRKAAAR